MLCPNFQQNVIWNNNATSWEFLYLCGTEPSEPVCPFHWSHMKLQRITQFLCRIILEYFKKEWCFLSHNPCNHASTATTASTASTDSTSSPLACISPPPWGSVCRRWRGRNSCWGCRGNNIRSALLRGDRQMIRNIDRMTAWHYKTVTSWHGLQLHPPLPSFISATGGYECKWVTFVTFTICFLSINNVVNSWSICV